MIYLSNALRECIKRINAKGKPRIKLMNLESKEEFEDEAYDDSDDELEDDLDLTESVQEVKDELAVQSELIEELIQVIQEKNEQDKQFQNNLIAVLEKIAAKA